MMLSQTMTKASKQIRWQTTERLVRTVSSKHLAHSNKTRIVIVGSGWGGFGFLKAIDKVSGFNICTFHKLISCTIGKV